MAGQETQSGISMHYLESIARVSPYMTIAELVALLHENDAADPHNGATSSTESLSLTRASDGPHGEALDVRSAAVDSSAASVQSAPPTSQPPTDAPAANTQGLSQLVPQGVSSFEAQDTSILSATQQFDQQTDSGHQDSVQSVSIPPSSTTTPQLALDDANGGTDVSNPGFQAGLTNNLTPTASQPTPLNQALGLNATPGVTTTSVRVGRNHATLEICGDKTGKQLLEANSGIDTKQICGARALLVGLAGIPFTKVAGMLNAKREGEQLQDGKLMSTKAFDKRVEHAIRHIFGVPKGAAYKARRNEYSDAQKDPVLRQKYIDMLKDPATYQINPTEQCEGCNKNQATQDATQDPQHVSQAAAAGLTPVSNPSMAPNVPNTNAAGLNTISSVPGQSGPAAKAPRRKRKAAASDLHNGEDSTKRWQGEPQTGYPQAQSTYGHSFFQDATTSSQPAYPQAPLTQGYSFIQGDQSTYQSATTGPSNLPAFPAHQAQVMAPIAQFNAEHSDRASRYGNAPQQSTYIPSSPPLGPYTPQDNVGSFDSEGNFDLNLFTNAPNSDMGFATSEFGNLSNVNLSGFTSDAFNGFDQDRFFFSEANPTFGGVQQPNMSDFFPQYNEPSSAVGQYNPPASHLYNERSSALGQHDPPADEQANAPSSAHGQYDASADDQGSDGGDQDSSEHGHEQN
ncbi:hypothetical protein CB0940_03627 [Cercospora beticola]|uniref:Uncharacterized protein n=1 Tax=Cercospora beticola TaxID=122368 RepID=A0A2G5I4U4_CERBT|nr:hypothetical protein CB0940_03627 [Cercospora beticola]PIA99761.1 hypothetical protein CB0940_03627 [Cercospora beticola]WPB00807.1 hypothetical protein RHO25_005427 [Cercospora beticola]CAK1360954.1 unnamed protein product [Cercospora beticola]